MFLLTLRNFMDKVSLYPCNLLSGSKYRFTKWSESAILVKNQKKKTETTSKMKKQQSKKLTQSQDVRYTPSRPPLSYQRLLG